MSAILPPPGYCVDGATGAIASIDRNITANYNAAYVARYEAYPEERLSHIRWRVMRDFSPRVSATVCDVGFGTGAFLRACSQHGCDTYGHDVSDYPAPAWVKPAPDWAVQDWDVLTFFDSLEHFQDLGFVAGLRADTVVVSLPWCHYAAMGAEWFAGWRHLRPGEHLWHFDPASLTRLFGHAGYRCVYVGNPEDAVRTPPDALPNILTCVFRQSA